MNCEALAWGFGISIIGGTIFLPCFMWFIGKSMPRPAPTPRAAVPWIGKAVPVIYGIIERAAFALMTYLTPDSAFIVMGGWMALKFGATWKRDFGQTPLGRLNWAGHSQLSLLGSLVSMLFAAAGGLMARHVVGLPLVP